MATEHETMGYCLSFTRVSNHSPSTYMFHVLSKMKPVVKIKYLIAIPLSKHTSHLSAAIWWWECTGVMASCGCPAAEGQAGRDPSHQQYLLYARLPSCTGINP